MKVLCVEDNHDVRELIERMLVDEGLQVTVCATSEQAQLEFAKQIFDVLITDVNLPHTSGTELATRMQQYRPDLWLVFCSGCPMQDRLAHWGPRARSLLKPFAPEELQGLLRDIRSGGGRSTFRC